MNKFLFLFLMIFSYNSYSNQLSYEYSKNNTGYLTRVLIREHRIIEKHKQERQKTNSQFGTQERIRSLSLLRNNDEIRNMKNDIQIPLIWYVERF